MKQLLLIFTLLLNIQFGYAIEKKHIWPISNEHFGSQILYTPDSYIEEEYNEGNLFIGGKEGSFIVSPLDGKIVSLFYQYFKSLKTSEIFSEEYFNRIKNLEKTTPGIDPQFISLTIGIEINPGDIVYLSGIEKVRLLKTGARIHQGDTLGKLSFSYKKVKVPSLAIGRSVYGVIADPMEPLGLQSTFIKNYQKINPLETIGPDKLKTDFLVFRKSIEEGHPGLYDYISKASLDKIFDSTVQTIKTPLTILDFENILSSIVVLFRDKHTQFLTDYDELKMMNYQKQKWVAWPIRMSWEGDNLIVTGATKMHESLIGKSIKTINGFSADYLRKRAEKYCYSEGFVKSSCQFFMFTTWVSKLPDILNLGDDKSLFIVFNDGTHITLKNLKSIEKILPSWKGYIEKWNRDIVSKILNDSTAWIDLSTFDLNDVHTDSILNFTEKISKSKISNLIIDVRYNNGGNPESVATIFSLFVKEPFSITEGEMVTSNGAYDFFQNTKNYKGVVDPFARYKLKGKNGYWLPVNDIPQYFPNDTLRFEGHIYVLANEHTFSAASLFVTLMRKYRRGMIIGRETANPYHQMFGDKFAHVELPNTHIAVRIPLIKKVFDTTTNAMEFYGRGVLPDYEVPLVRSEFEFKEDAYVEKAKELIHQRIFLQYDSLNEVYQKNILKSPLFSLRLISLIVIVIVIVIVSYLLYKSKKYKRLNSD